MYFIYYSGRIVNTFSIYIRKIIRQAKTSHRFRLFLRYAFAYSGPHHASLPAALPRPPPNARVYLSGRRLRFFSAAQKSGAVKISAAAAAPVPLQPEEPPLSFGTERTRT